MLSCTDLVQFCALFQLFSNFSSFFHIVCLHINRLNYTLLLNYPTKLSAQDQNVPSHIKIIIFSLVLIDNSISPGTPNLKTQNQYICPMYGCTNNKIIKSTAVVLGAKTKILLENTFIILYLILFCFLFQILATVIQPDQFQ